jgi:hypothetical protein
LELRGGKELRAVMLILLITTSHQNITLFLSLLSERREMRASEKMPSWVWV